jgi:hypothetical protein
MRKPCARDRVNQQNKENPYFKITEGGHFMAMSKALQTRHWWEEIDASIGSRCLGQPTWLSRSREQATSKTGKVDADQPTLSHSSPDKSKDVAIYPTLHAERRMAQRNLSDEEVAYVLLYGQTWHKAGAVISYLRRKDLPHVAQTDQRWQQLIGAAVVMTADERIVLTAYRNRQSGLRNIKCKPDYGW